MKFEGKTVVVTGAGSGLGRDLALRLGERGASLACIDYNARSLAETGALLEARAMPCSLHEADISRHADVARVIDEIERRHEGFDVLINNAGIMQSFNPIARLGIDEIERITQVNYWGMVLVVKASLPILESRPEASIVNISSLSALMPFPGQAVYSASKAAVRSFSEGLGQELRSKGIDVMLVMPGVMRTPLAENSPFLSGADMERFRGMSSGRGLGLSSDRAALQILRAIERRRTRVVLGIEARILDKCYRVAPMTTNRVVRWAMGLSPMTRIS